jgi:aspartyl-tRNA synthetase
VPSRVNEVFIGAAKPQLFKRLLMVGLTILPDRKCFRDLRTGPPAGIPQIDETSFMTEEDIRELFQGMITSISSVEHGPGRIPIIPYTRSHAPLWLGQADTRELGSPG